MEAPPGCGLGQRCVSVLPACTDAPAPCAPTGGKSDACRSDSRQSPPEASQSSPRYLGSGPSKSQPISKDRLLSELFISM